MLVRHHRTPNNMRRAGETDIFADIPKAPVEERHEEEGARDKAAQPATWAGLVSPNETAQAARERKGEVEHIEHARLWEQILRTVILSSHWKHRSTSHVRCRRRASEGWPHSYFVLRNVFFFGFCTHIQMGTATTVHWCSSFFQRGTWP